jgi:hypothetical protein
MKRKLDSRTTTRAAGGEAEALNTLNARARRKMDVRRLMEATIEKKAKSRRNEEAPASSAWKAA